MQMLDASPFSNLLKVKKLDTTSLSLFGGSKLICQSQFFHDLYLRRDGIVYILFVIEWIPRRPWFLQLQPTLSPCGPNNSSWACPGPS
jgi:hypothetical protein